MVKYNYWFILTTAIALCHNVTPMYDDESTSTMPDTSDQIEADQLQHKQSVTYQASSPDEVSIGEEKQRHGRGVGPNVKEVLFSNTRITVKMTVTQIKCLLRMLLSTQTWSSLNVYRNGRKSN